MIEYLPYSSVDKSKYDQCLSMSPDFRIYAQSWYLDAVCEKWDLIVHNDYEAVMPLPHRKKFGLKYIFTPPWVQQLGIFSAGDISEGTKEKMFKSIPRDFFLIDYMSNFLPMEIMGKHELRQNYILGLHDNLEKISGNFKKNRKSAFKKDFSAFSLQKKGVERALLEMYDITESVDRGHKDARGKLSNLMRSGSESLNTWVVFRFDLPVAGMVWLKDSRRITYLYSVVLPEHRKLELPTFMLRSLMEEFMNSGLLLDFEGSMHPGIAFFYRSFGAEIEEYYHFKSKFYGFFG